MTNEQAIDYIMGHCFDCEHMQDGECVADNQCFEANRLAINALYEQSIERTYQEQKKILQKMSADLCIGVEECTRIINDILSEGVEE